MLTDSELRSAIGRAKTDRRTIALRDTGKTQGLEFRASYGGTASFAYLYKPEGATSAQRFRLGVYGPKFGLADARAAATLLREKRRLGIDPIMERRRTVSELRANDAERRRLDEADRKRITFGELARLYLGAAPEGRHRTYDEIYRHDIERVLGAIPAADVSRPMIQGIVDRIVDRGANVQSRRSYEVLRAILRWGRSRDYITSAPWEGVLLPPKNSARKRVLTARELRWIWTACEREWAARSNLSQICRLQILLGQRPGEICGLVRIEIAPDVMIWTIPGRRTKNKRTHVVPLPPLAREIIREVLAESMNATHVFVGSRGAVARGDGFAHGLKDLIDQHNETATEADQIEHFTPHDLRRTVSTALESLRVSDYVISMTLNHISAKSSSVTKKHYSHADLQMEIRAGLTLWQATLAKILAGEDPLATRPSDIEDLERKLLGGAI